MPTRKTNYARSEKVNERNIDIPLDDLIGKANLAFSQAGYTLWILFDRLDVAFNDSPEVERNALRALFRMYNDFKGYDSIKLKVFVRDDIWDRISEGGFAEASHITKTTKIEWSFEGLVNLFVRRLLNNQPAVAFLDIRPDEVQEDFDKQVAILKRILPDKVETGKNPETFRWMTNRIQDGAGKPAPRELIHMLEVLRQQQISRVERGESEPLDELLFDRAVFKLALREVSRVRYDQTFLAENPSLKHYTDKLKGQKTEQNITSLSGIWETSHEETTKMVERLVKAGFFERRQSDAGDSLWVPFVYRDALEMVQGKAFDSQIVSPDEMIGLDDESGEQ